VKIIKKTEKVKSVENNEIASKEHRNVEIK
jgi:hypothetical protein